MGKEKSKKMIILNKYQIIHNAYIDITGLLKALASFFDANKYDYDEIGVSEKSGATGDEVESVWKATREVTDYVMFDMMVTVWARDLRKVVVDGKEMYWARVMITIDSHAKKNWNKTFGSGHWQELMRQGYERYVVYKDMDAYKGKIYVESMLLIDEIKKYLK